MRVSLDELKAIVAGILQIGDRLNTAGPDAALLGGMTPIAHYKPDVWDNTFAVNVTATFLCTQAVLPQMIAAGGGSIVCTSSISAVAGTPMEVLYDTTKGACHMFARAIAVEFRDQGWFLNLVAEAQTELFPMQLLGHVLRVERRHQTLMCFKRLHYLYLHSRISLK